MANLAIIPFNMSSRAFRVAVLAVMMLLSLAAWGEGNYFVRGIVRDSISDEPIPYASIVVGNSGRGGVTDSQGIFEMSVPNSARSLQITCVGYEKKVLPIKRGNVNMYAVYLSPSTTELREVVVKKGKYSKKNNPAVDFQRRLRSDASLTDPERNDYYGYDKYERITLGLNEFNAADHAAMARKIPELAEHIDTSEVSGKPYLSLLVKEKKSRRNFRRSPRAVKETIEGSRSVGIDEMFDQQSMRILAEDILREIDLYENDINILQNRFVSPLSRIAPDFYKFYLTDTVEVDGERCIVLSFYPHNRAAFGFTGHVYVPEADTTMFIRKVEMSIPREINLNWVDNMYISQTFDRAADGSRLKTSDVVTMELSVVAGKGKMYASRRTAYSDHSFEAIADSVFRGAGATIELAGAKMRDDEFWAEARAGAAIKSGEKRLDLFMHKIRRMPLIYWGERIIKILFSGYVPIGKDSKFDFGPVNSVMSFNSIEKVRLRVGGMTTANLSPRWFGRFYVAYGVHDHRWKYQVEAEYSFLDKEYHSREFPSQSIRLVSMYDLDRPGEHYDYTSPDNIVLSLGRVKNDRATYRRYNSIAFNYETRDNFTGNIEIANIRQEAAPTMPLIDGFGQDIRHFSENQVVITLRYAPGEKFYQTRTYRIPINLDAPAITLRQTLALKGLFGTRYSINKTELDLAKRWWFSAWGYLDTYLSGGHVWSTSSFLSLHIPNVNTSYIVQPRSFALMNPMEFITTTYAAADITYYANGALLNYVPQVKKLKLREVFGFRAFWGRLDNRCNPALHPELPVFPAETGITKLNRGPYMEASVGLENIFRVLRVDYVWRLNYRNVPYRIDRGGVRIAVHLTF